METATIEVNNHEQFRRVALISSLGCSCVSAIILACTPSQCFVSGTTTLQANLTDGVIIVASV